MPYKPTALHASLPAYQPPETEQFIDLHKSALYRYLDEITNQEVYLDNQGLELDDSDGDRVLVHIDELYVVPHLSEQRISPEELVEAGEDQQAVDKLPLRSVAEMLSTHPRAVILGDPGVGKSTLLKWLLCSLSHWSDNYARRRIGPLFPLLLRARNLTADTIVPCDNDDFIQLILRLQGKSLSQCIAQDSEAYQVLQDRLACGQVLLMVDGLDEVSDRVKAWLAEQIKQLLSDYPKMRLLMTSRVVGFEQSELWHSRSAVQDLEPALKSKIGELFKRRRAGQVTATGLLAISYLVPFLPEQRRTFLKNWSRKYLPPQQERQIQFQEKLEEVSINLKQINLLSRIPVLLNLICFVQWRSGQLPDGRAELYKRIVGTYLESMDKVRNMTPDFNGHYDYKDICNWLGKLAFCMQAGDLCLPTQPLNIVSEDDSILEEYREQLPVIGSQDLILQITQAQLEKFLVLQLTEVMSVYDAEQQCKKLIDYLKYRTGFIIPKGKEADQELYGFSHLSFQEYFSAYFISLNFELVKEEAGSNEKYMEVFNSLLSSASNEEWEEIWQLVFEELTLQGKSRKQLDRLFNMLFSEAEFESFNVPEVKALISSNRAIKLSDKVKQCSQSEVAGKVLSYSIRHSPVFYNITRSYIKDSHKLSMLLTRLDKVLIDEQMLSGHWPESNKFYDEVYVNYETISFVERLPAYKTKSLSLCSDKVTALPSLSQFSEINSLSLKCLNVCERKDLSSLRQVSHAEVYDGSSAILESLTTLPNLKQLRFQVADLKRIPIFQYVESMEIGLSVVNDFSCLKKIPELQSLWLTFCTVGSGANWLELLELKKLKKIEIQSLYNDCMPPKRVLRRLEKSGIQVITEMVDL
ncbi:NACHT domain-containing protein [Pseudoalteromonas ardens]|uniref:NACHT domain-containing protein n=1 Tax=Pseudoalteromonas ardens TaxID=3048490 RepID=UPI000676A4B2|nr:NACHT domain-containing protein [Pseudoalteromonas sp. R96]MDK1311906.1 NACHT domain-containing protein [Pseudoalteromonas sp. R96]